MRIPALLLSVPLTTLTALVALTALGAMSGCSSKPQSQWVEADMAGPSERVLWEVTRLALRESGFPVIQAGFDPVTRSASSGWRRDMHPFSGEGYRERVVVGYEPGEPGSIRLKVRVQRELNKNISRPLDPEYADWEPAEDDPSRARMILQHILSTLGQPLEFGEGS